VAGARRSVPAGLGGTLQGFFWAVAGMALVASVLAVVALLAFNSWWNTPVRSVAEARALDDWIDADDGFAAFAGLYYIGAFVVFVLLLVWMNLAHKATQDLWPGLRSWSSGWTVGAWFVPIANLILPKLVMDEIERIALAPRAGTSVADGWQRRPTLAVGWLWWLPFVVGIVLTTIGAGIGDEVDSSVTEVRASYVASAIGFAALAAGAVCGALYVRRIGGRLSPAGSREVP
jgi:hypothetical protein